MSTVYKDTHHSDLRLVRLKNRKITAKKLLAGDLLFHFRTADGKAYRDQSVRLSPEAVAAMWVLAKNMCGGEVAICQRFVDQLKPAYKKAAEERMLHER